MLHQNGLSPGIVEDPYAPIPLHLYLNFFEQAAAMADDELLGARLGAEMRPGNLGPIGLRAVQAGTMQSGLEALARFSSALQSGTESVIEADGDCLLLRYLITDIAKAPKRQDAEFSLSCICSLIRAGFDPRWRPMEVHFRHAEPSCRRQLEQVFGAPLRFDQASNLIVIAMDDATRVHRTEDPDLIALIERHISDLIAKTHHASRLSDKVKALIVLYLGARPVTLQTISALLDMSPRSLQRALAEEGLSLSDLIRTYRRDRASWLLTSSDLSVEAIAASLGYADGTAFWRAFRGWTGKTPTDLRAQSRGV
ncbi:AraC family transcriptional regulator [Tropicimonas sp. IMCC34043]|uniref:AraC family transcriptional regulator n=1 Tax=Tropicimonas sp. IMCC34043 TaxID=2248760 RepID=UPI0018E53000|nr:AraC family transcriptional regulator [Tropicimonas sp. IMCC34043]